MKDIATEVGLVSTELIGFGGLFGSGKDTAADWLVAQRGYCKVNLSEPIVAMYSELDPWIRLQAPPDGVSTFLRYSYLVSTFGFTAAKQEAEVREGLQKIARSGRAVFGSDAWLQVTEARVQALLARSVPVVISGVRFPQEIEAIRRLGGVTLWVERSNYGQRDADESENSVGANDFDSVLLNGGTLSDLFKQLDRRFSRHA